MNSLRKIFNHKTSSVSSPVAPTDTIKNNKKPKLFRRTNTTKSLDVDLKSQTRRTSSWSRKSPSEHTLLSSKYNTQPGEQNLKTSRSAGALLDNNSNNYIYSKPPNQASFQSNSSSTLSPSLSSSTSQVPTTNSRMKNVELSALNTGNNANSAGQNDSRTPDTPITQRQNEADEYIQQAIQFHESNELEEATRYFKLAADKQSPLGMFLYGIALRHGWGCRVNPKLAVKYLQKAAESAVNDLHASMAANPSIARHELVLAIYELGVSFRHGWGVPKNKSTAAYYFEIAANLGDPDAQNDLGACYSQGEGVKKDMKKAAKYYRMANAQGAGIMGNSWIFKKKYDD